MVRNLEANGFRLPAYTSYNGGHIPFAYPPLGLYVAGALNRLFGIDLFAVFRLLPLLIACAALVAFVPLARSLLSRGSAAAAVFAFALLPDAFDMEIRGGGITRSFGELFAIVALWQGVRVFRDGRRAALLPLSAALALTALSHLEWAQFAAVSVVMMMLAWRRTWVGRRDVLLAGVAALVLCAPWWLTVVLRHGVAPFLAAMTGNAQVFPLQNSVRAVITLTLTHEIWFPVIGMLALAGLLVCIGERRPFLPVWLGIVLLTDARGWAIPLALPVALLAGAGLVDGVLPLLLRARPDRDTRLPRVAAIVLAVLLLRGVGGAAAYEEQNNPSISPAERQAMGWVSHHTAADTRFLVFAAATGSSQENVEWFPALTGRQSVETVQGQEWVPGVYARRFAQVQRIEACLPRLACVDRVLRLGRVRVDDVYLAKSVPDAGCTALCAQIAGSRDWRLVYDGPGARIFRRHLRAPYV